jgi:hypothetical protein
VRIEGLVAAEADPEWLAVAWRQLDEREQAILTRRLAGETLAQLGESYGLSRERIRQIQVKAEDHLTEAMDFWMPDKRGQLLEAIGDSPAVASDHLALQLPSTQPLAREALVRAIGVGPPRGWFGELHGWWTTRPTALESLLARLSDLAPLPASELPEICESLGIPGDLAVAALLERDGSGLVRHTLGWIRPARASRDVAYLWLRAEGGPRTVVAIAQMTDTSERGMRETMRRDDGFAQVRPEGTWGLTAWRLPGADSRYSSAVEVVVDVLRELGPLDYEQLKVETQRRYPVTEWRVTQCLSSSMVGRTAVGLYDLAERGAVPLVEKEPQRPANAGVSGNVLGVALEVTHDMLRGSGFGVNRWITWELGLRTAPSSRHFDLNGSPGGLSVKRTTSLAQVSSIRVELKRLALTVGCKFVLLLRTDTNVARLQHTCGDLCPNVGADNETQDDESSRTAEVDTAPVELLDEN